MLAMETSSKLKYKYPPTDRIRVNVWSGYGCMVLIIANIVPAGTCQLWKPLTDAKRCALNADMMRPLSRDPSGIRVVLKYLCTSNGELSGNNYNTELLQEQWVGVKDSIHVHRERERERERPANVTHRVN